MTDKENVPAKQRLVIDLTAQASADLARMCEMEGLNKTIVTNRAIQLYRRILEAQSRGGGVTLQESDEAQPIRILFL